MKIKDYRLVQIFKDIVKAAQGYYQESQFDLELDYDEKEHLHKITVFLIGKKGKSS